MENSPLFRFYYDNRKHLPGLVTIVALSLVSGVLKTLSAAYWGRAVDFGVAGLVEDMLFAAVLMALFILLDCLRTALHYRLIGHITEDMFLDVRARAFDKLTHADPSALEETFRTGDIAARLNGDIDFLSTFSAGHISNFSRQIFSGLFGLTACIFISWQLAISYMIILPLSLWLVGTISKPIQAQIKGSMDSTGSAISTAVETISGALTVKAFTDEGVMEKRFDAAVTAACQQRIRSERLSMKMTGIKYLSNVIQSMCLFLVGSWLVSFGYLTVGAFVSFVTLSAYITSAFEQSDYMIKSFRNASASAARYYEVIDIPEERPGFSREAASPTPCSAEGLSFAYGNGVRALNDLSIQVPAGKKVAVVGPSGCGKSTLVKLLCRFYFPERGELSMFGAETAEWDPRALRENLAIVTQDSCLFSGSFYENIALGRPGVSREECQRVLEDVRLWDFVCGFPDGMDHAVGEGGMNLSGGQRQRLCIARAMVKNASLVLLDEATSALDLQTEREVQEALDKLLQGRSVVMIAHRLSTVQNADHIYVMEEGGIAEEGAPAELLRKKGRYYQMCLAQGLVEVES